MTIPYRARSTTIAVLLCALNGGCASAPPMPPALRDGLVVEAEQEVARGSFDRAASIYKRIVNADPNRAGDWHRLGTLYLRMKKLDVAGTAFERALLADPELTKAHANLALTHLLQFRSAAALAVVSDQVPEANRLALQAMLRDVDNALAPVKDADMGRHK